MAEKLAAGKVEIVVFGEISTGKSAMINALVGEAVADVNVRGGWTKDVWNLGWNGAGYCVPGLANSEVVLIDTPGLNEVDGAQRAAMAHEAASRADLVLFVIDSDLNEVEYSALVELAASHKPIVLVLNKADLYSPEELAELMSVFRGPRLAGIVDPENVVIGEGRSAAGGILCRVGRRSDSAGVAKAGAGCGGASRADFGSAGGRRQSTRCAQRRHVCGRQKRSHGRAASADAQRKSDCYDLELRRDEGAGRGAQPAIRLPTCWAARFATPRWSSRLAGFMESKSRRQMPAS